MEEFAGWASLRNYHVYQEGRKKGIKIKKIKNLYWSTVSYNPKLHSDDDAASTSSARSLGEGPLLCLLSLLLTPDFIIGSRGGSPRPEADDRVLSSIMHRWGSIIGSSGTGGSRLAGRGRFVVRRRGAGRPLLSRWPLMPAVDVPEELVDQVGMTTVYGLVSHLFWLVSL